MNTVILMGRMTKDPVLKTTPSQKTVTTFTLAVDRKYQKDTTDFIQCTAWNKTAEFITRYFPKGRMIAVEGAIQTRSYTGNDGQNRYVTEVIVENAFFTGSKNETPQNGNFADNSPVDNSDYTDTGFMAEYEDLGTDEDLPF